MLRKKKKWLSLCIVLACIFAVSCQANTWEGTLLSVYSPQSENTSSKIEESGEGSSSSKVDKESSSLASSAAENSSSISSSSETEETPPEGAESFSFEEEGEYYIVSGMGNVTDSVVVLPSTHNGKAVRKIKSGAFAGETLLKLVVPEGIEEIGEHAFIGCENLLEVELPAGLRRIGESAFGFCTSLESVHFAEPRGWYAGGIALPIEAWSKAEAAKYLAGQEMYKDFTLSTFVWERASE